MQIIELYIADGYVIRGASVSVSANQLISFNLSFDGSLFSTSVEVGAEVRNLDSNEVAFVTSIANESTLNLSNDIFLYELTPYEICNPFKRLDLFEDESVSITDTIKNIKDVAKVFTPFSQQFNVPASKANSKFFKHYSNSDVQDSFDARYKAKGLIKLNGVDYKKGKISLQSVSLKNNKPHAYKLVFYGETIELKDLLAENELSSLQFPEALNFDYTSGNILSRFTSSPTNIPEDICVPLITHSKNMRFTTDYLSTDNELINFTDLKPAIRVRTIIDAIQEKYPEIQFSDEFLNTTDFRSLYLWLHKEKGFMSNGDDSEDSNTITSVFNQNPSQSWQLDSGDDIRPYAFINSYGNISSGGNSQVTLSFSIQMSSQSTPYSLIIRRNSDNATIFNSEELTGNQVITFTLSVYTYGTGYVDITIDLVTENILTLTQFELTATRTTTLYIVMGFPSTSTSTGVYSLAQTSTANDIIINRHFPKIKIIDFLSNLFKMFNLVVYKLDTGIIRVIPLDDYYAEGVNYDITRYVDTEKSSIKKVLQYKNIRFNFSSRVTFLVQKFQELMGSIFSEESYGSQEWDGSDYNIDIGFEKMMFERLTNSSSNLTDVCQGAMLDKDFNAVLGKPLMFYVKNQTTGSNTFTFENIGGTNTTITRYNRPSQIFVPETGTVSSESSSLNFGSEIDEFFLSVIGKNLFSKYYQNYIESVFAKQGRILKVDAYLPLHIILKYKLNDVFIISNKSYRINSVKTNLLTNKSSLELYSLQEPITNIQNLQSAYLDRVGSYAETGKGKTFVDLSWTAPTMTGLVGFDIMLDDNLFSAVGSGVTTIKVQPLSEGVSYKLAVRSKYQNGSNIGYSEDVVLFVTTDSADLVTTENSVALVTELGENIIIE